MIDVAINAPHLTLILAEPIRLAEVSGGAQGWRPTVDNYLGPVTEARILGSMRKAKGRARSSAYRSPEGQNGGIHDLAVYGQIPSRWAMVKSAPSWERKSETFTVDLVGSSFEQVVSSYVVGSSTANYPLEAPQIQTALEQSACTEVSQRMERELGRWPRGSASPKGTASS
jgi:hypothetical protein